MIKVITLISLLIISGQAFFKYSQQTKESQVGFSGQHEQWFSKQILNHFQPQPVKYWNQRYFVIPDYFDKETGPIFLYICGEYTCTGLPEERQFTRDLAEKYNGIIITLEHRFYGASQPFGYDSETYSTENLKYLTQDQALADIAVFIGWIKQKGIYGIQKNTPVITVGGSYPGAMSAWFRYNYRHLTIGAYASSAVVEAIEDFMDYDKQIGISTGAIGNYCPEDIRTMNDYVQRQLEDPLTATEVKSIFKATMLTDVEFLAYVADNISHYVQYGSVEQLCEEVFKNKTILQQLASLAEVSYDAEGDQVSYLKETAYDVNSASRQWFYQTCTAFGWFQTAYIPDPMRSLLIDLDYYENQCKEVFGDEYIPDVPLTNVMMGGRKFKVDNVIFTNGAEDPWQWASITEDEPPMKAYVANCIGCAHCCDLYTPKESDPPELKYVREQVQENISQWLNEYWGNQEQEQQKEIYQ